MIIKKINKPITSWDFIQKVKKDFIKVEPSIIVIHFDNYNESYCMLAEGNYYTDIIKIIDDFFIDFPDDAMKFFAIYEPTEVLSEYTDEEIDEFFFPLNGGEYYTDAISFIENLEGFAINNSNNIHMNTTIAA